MSGQFPHTVAWCGPRHLLLGGTHLLDLDLSTPIWNYVIKELTRAARTSPDGRTWYTAADKAEEITKHFKGSKLGGAETSYGYFLAAWTAPHAEATKRLEAGRRGFVWCPGKAVRILVEGEVGGVRQAAAEKLAGAVAKSGIRVDPAAPAALRLTFSPPKTGEEAGKILKEESAGRFKPGWKKVTFEVKNLTCVTAKLEVLDAKGIVCGGGNVLGGAEEGTDSKAARVARDKVVDQLAQPSALNLSAVRLLDVGYQPILLPSRSGIGIDGVQTPAPEDVR
jgi:hypothetical protein